MESVFSRNYFSALSSILPPKVFVILLIASSKDAEIMLPVADKICSMT